MAFPIFQPSLIEMKSYALLFISFALFSVSQAQVLMEAPLPEVRQNTYWDLVLGPEVSAHLAPRAQNLRILDSNGVEVPYLFDCQAPSKIDVHLKWYPARGERTYRRRYSRSVFENPRRDAIDEIVLKIRNADVTQHFWLSGSDDGMHWHIIKEDYVYDRAYDLSSTYNLLTLQFPPVDYRYYKVEIRHYWREPIQIMGAGYYQVDALKGRYEEVPGIQVAQSDDMAEKRSFVEIDLGQNHYVDRLHLQVDGPDRYHRKAWLEGDGIREEIVLSSKEVARFSFEDLRTQRLRLTIENLDDQPIHVVRARAYQSRQSVTARLWPGMSGKVVVYDEAHRAPAYDLVHFEEELPRRRPVKRLDSLLVLPDLGPEAAFEEAGFDPSMEAEDVGGVGEMQREGVGNAGAVEKAEEQDFKSWVQHPVFLWGGILLLGGLMVWFSVRALKEGGEGE